MSVPYSIPQGLENRYVRFSELAGMSRFRVNRNAIQNIHRPLSWKDGGGVIHVTEVMVDLWSGFNRVTLCRRFMFKQNEQPLDAEAVLDIVPCDSAVSCLGCLGEV